MEILCDPNKGSEPTTGNNYTTRDTHILVGEILIEPIVDESLHKTSLSDSLVSQKDDL